MRQDPVCGRNLIEDLVADISIYGDKIFYFCSWSCREQFEKEPARYIKNNVAESKDKQ